MAKLDQLARKVYIGLRYGGLDPEATFGLACMLMNWGHLARPYASWPNRAHAGERLAESQLSRNSHQHGFPPLMRPDYFPLVRASKPGFSSKFAGNSQEGTRCECCDISVLACILTIWEYCEALPSLPGCWATE
jgi:hypothetical protein